MPIFRILLTLVVVLIALGLNFVWESLEAPMAGEVAVLQLDDSMIGYTLAKRASEHIPQRAITICAGTMILLMWTPFLLRRRDLNRDIREDKETTNTPI